MRCCFQPQPPDTPPSKAITPLTKALRVLLAHREGGRDAGPFGSSQSAPSAGPSGPAEGNVAYLPRDALKVTGSAPWAHLPPRWGYFL